MKIDSKKWHLPKGSPIQRSVSPKRPAGRVWESFITTKDAYYEFKDFASTSQKRTCINIPLTGEYDMIVIHPNLLIECHKT